MTDDEELTRLRERLNYCETQCAKDMIAQDEEITRLLAENKILRYKLDLLLQAAYSEEYTTSFFRVSAMRDILGVGNE